MLEVNTQLQVEHPAIEAVTEVDLLREQFRERVSLSEASTPVVHAFESRVNAEDPGRGFLASPGRVEKLRTHDGSGVRRDSGIGEGDIVQVESRDAALMRRAGHCTSSPSRRRRGNPPGRRPGRRAAEARGSRSTDTASRPGLLAGFSRPKRGDARPDPAELHAPAPGTLVR